jgi:transcriptional regulator GlxA family with amidase domain
MLLIRSCLLSCERPTTHWEWRNGKSSVYPRVQGLDWRRTVLSGGVGPSHILEDPGEG